MSARRDRSATRRRCELASELLANEGRPATPPPDATGCDDGAMEQRGAPLATPSCRRKCSTATSFARLGLGKRSTCRRITR